jgi:hypothetical protein
VLTLRNYSYSSETIKHLIYKRPKYIKRARTNCQSEKYFYFCAAYSVLIHVSDSLPVDLHGIALRNKYFIISKGKIMINQYETVFIATPVLSDAQFKEVVANSAG